MLKAASGRAARSPTDAPSGRPHGHRARWLPARHDFGHIVAIAETERGGAENVQLLGATWSGRVRRRQNGGQAGRKFRPRPRLPSSGRTAIRAEQPECQGPASRQGRRDRPAAIRPCRKRRPATRRGGTGDGIRAGLLEEVGGRRRQVTGLERGVGHRRARRTALDHGEEQIRIGVALGGVQHIMQALHRGGDPHGADMGRSLVGPHRTAS